MEFFRWHKLGEQSVEPVAIAGAIGPGLRGFREELSLNFGDGLAGQAAAVMG